MTEPAVTNLNVRLGIDDSDGHHQRVDGRDVHLGGDDGDGDLQHGDGRHLGHGGDEFHVARPKARSGRLVLVFWQGVRNPPPDYAGPIVPEAATVFRCPKTGVYGHWGGVMTCSRKSSIHQCGPGRRGSSQRRPYRTALLYYPQPWASPHTDWAHRPAPLPTASSATKERYGDAKPASS